MKKQYIVPIVVLILFAGGMGAVYQFYFRIQLEQYAKNTQMQADLNKRLEELQTTFSGADKRPVSPDEFVSQWRGAVQPWNDALVDRSTYFIIPEPTERAPENAVPKFFYRERFPTLITQLQQYAYSRSVMIPDTTFGAPLPSDLDNRSVDADQVNGWLRQLSAGTDVIKLLVDNGAAQVVEVDLWPAYIDNDLLEKRTVGVRVLITLEKLTAFLDKLYAESRYFNVDAVRIHNTSVRTPYQPWLEVEMLITQAKYVEGGQAKAAPQASGAQAAGATGDPMAKMMDALKAKRAAAGKDKADAATTQTKSWWRKYLPF